MFRAVPLPIIRSFPLYIQHLYIHITCMSGYVDQEFSFHWVSGFVTEDIMTGS